MAKYDKNISFTKMPNDYINEMLNNGETTKAMIFMLDLMTESLRGKKFATRTIEKEIKDASVSIATISRFRKEFNSFMTIFKAAQDNSARKTMKQNSNSSETPMKQKQSKTKPTTKADKDTLKDTNVTPMKQECNSSETINKIKNKINIFKEEEEEIYKHFGDIFLDKTSLQVFSSEFYDYLYPMNNKSEIQKYWYGNTTKDMLLDLDKRTIENVKEYLEDKSIQSFMNNKEN